MAAASASLRRNEIARRDDDVWILIGQVDAKGAAAACGSRRGEPLEHRVDRDLDVETILGDGCSRGRSARARDRRVADLRAEAAERGPDRLHRPLAALASAAGIALAARTARGLLRRDSSCRCSTCPSPRSRRPVTRQKRGGKQRAATPSRATRPTRRRRRSPARRRCTSSPARTARRAAASHAAVSRSAARRTRRAGDRSRSLRR